MAAVERVWADGARVWPQVQTRPIDISWTMGQRSIMFLAIPGWWNVLAMGDPAKKLEALADPAVKATARRRHGPGRRHPRRRAWTRRTTSSAQVALERNRDLVGRTLGDVAAERGTTRRRAAHRPVRRGGARHVVHARRARPLRPGGRRRPAGPPARPRRRQRRRRPRRLVRHVRRHRLPAVALRPRDRRPVARGRGQEDHRRPGRRSGASPTAAS